MNTGNLLDVATRQLDQAQSTSPALDAEVLLAHAAATTRDRVLANRNTPVPTTVRNRYRELVQRRAQQEPVAYLTGTKEFFGRAFRVTPDVLIPRPETESLVQNVLELVPATFKGTMLDVGTGSGAIAITLAHERPHATVIGTDVSIAALSVAQRNLQEHQVAVQLEYSDLLREVRSKRVDILIANLPYLRDGDTPYQPTTRARVYEPSDALYAGPDGMHFISRLLQEIAQYRWQPQWMVLERDPQQHILLKKALNTHLPRFVTIQNNADSFVALFRSEEG